MNEYKKMLSDSNARLAKIAELLRSCAVKRHVGYWDMEKLITVAEGKE